VLQRATKPAKELIAQNPPQDDLQTRATSSLVFARQGAAADVADSDSRWQQAGNRSKEAVCVFRCYGTQSRAESNRRTVYSKSSLPELALFFFQPDHQSAPQLFLFAKNGEKCEMCVCRCYDTRSRVANSRRNTYRQVGSARASPLSFSLIASRPRRLHPVAVF